MSMDEALAAVSAGTLELFSTAAARAPLLDYNEAIRQQDLGRSVVYNGEARNSLGRSDRCEKRGGRASNLVSTADLYDDTKPYEEIAAACTKIALVKGQGTRDTQERPTLEAEPRGQLPMRADVCAQLVLATMAAGRRCDNLSCNAALQIEPVLNLGYVAPSRSFCSRACMAASCDAQELCAHTPGEMPKLAYQLSPRNVPRILRKGSFRGLTRECPACATPYACTQPNGARGTRETNESRPFASHHDEDDTLGKVS